MPTRTEKLELELAAEEARLRQQLLRVLPDAAKSGSNVFTNSQFNPSNLPAHLFRPDAEGMLDSARECVQLRKLIGVDADGSVGALFLAACEENASTNQQRRGPRKLAASLLHSLHMALNRIKSARFVRLTSGCTVVDSET